MQNPQVESAMSTENQKKSLDQDLKQILSKTANTIRGLSIDAVQKADSGHPGLPMGCAELGAYLYGVLLKHNPKNPKWLNRDRVILSAGHGSMWLYSNMHLAGFNLSLEDLMDFRQLHSKTPGHPESRDTEGVETTTGPLGQGFCNAIGTALGLKHLAARFNTDKIKLIDSKVFTLMGDGCIMEGCTAEAASLAGHLKLDNIIAIYDSNNISLDGPLKECCSENTKMRYEAYGWEVFEVDGNDLDAIANLFGHIKENQERPRLVIAHTVIGKGSPNKAGSNKAHGSPLGQEEVRETKLALGIPEEPFFIPQTVTDYFKKKLANDIASEEDWNKLFEAWSKANPEKAKEFETMKTKQIPQDLQTQLQNLKIKTPIAGRKASQDIVTYLADLLPWLIGGSADLSCSDLTYLSKYSMITPGHFEGRNIKYGVREFAMGAIATGICQTGMLTPFIGTFLTFSDYMRNAIRLCSLMKEQVIYQFTHDSIFLGEDGPTHQPVEHLASLRAIPNLHVIRPGDQNEVAMAWIAALKYQGPTALILSRQSLPDLEITKIPYSEGVGKGAYILKKESSTPDFTLIATGSEVHLALDVAAALEKLGKSVRVVSMPCWEIFEDQSSEYKQSVLGGNLGKRVSIEAASDLGWHKYIGIDGTAICVEGFGASAPYRELTKEYGFTVESILERIL